MEDSIFHFNDRPALSVQCDSTCQQLYDHFFETMCDKEGVAELPREKLTQVKAKYQVHWMAHHGCAVLFGRVDSTSSAVAVVGLDRWKYHVHASTFGRERTAFSDVSHPSVTEFGLIPSNEIENIMETFRAKRTTIRNKRSRQKYHWTPTFASSLLWNTLQDLDFVSNIIPPENFQGGTTDVGLHTGCIPRNTSFPLVLAAVGKMISFCGMSCDNHFEKCVCLYFLHFLAETVGGIQSYSTRKIDRAFTIIRELETWMDQVRDDIFKEKVLLEIQKHHESLRSIRPDVDIDTSRLSLEPISVVRQSLKAPPFPHIPSHNVEKDHESALVLTKKEAQLNLKWSDLSHPMVSNGMQDTWLLLAQLNSSFWRMASELEDASKSQHIDLLKMIDTHSIATAHALKVVEHCDNIMSTVLDSCEVLAIWIGFCWVHRTATEKYPLFKKYSAALNPRNLRHLVLEDRRAVEAVGFVRKYLRSQRQSGLVPFRSGEHTRALALEFGRSSKNLRRIFDKEYAAAMAVIDGRNDEIVRKQVRLAELDKSLTGACLSLASAEQATSISEERDFTRDHFSGRKKYTSTYYATLATEDRFRSEVESIQSEIRQHERKPPDVYFPLPRNKDSALRWLFFIYMPSEFVDLLKLCQRGQSKLWQNAPSATTYCHSLKDWFTRHRRTSQSAEMSPLDNIALGTMSPMVSTMRTPDIRSYGKESGTFFPDQYVDQHFWIGTDPFSTVRSCSDTVLRFTEQLSPETEKVQLMQQFLPLLPSPTRGNLGISLRNKKPSWLTYEEFISFASLRAFPKMQIRQLLVALSGDLLPFQDKNVRTLVKQLMFHVGENSWRKDLKCEKILDLIAEQMKHQADLLSESPRSSEKILLFGTMCTFYGQHNRACFDCMSAFCRIARSFASGVEKEVKATERIEPRLYWKQATFYGYALLCHTVGERDKIACLQIAELIVLYRSKVLFALEIDGSLSLDQPILQMMASRINDIVDAVQSELDRLTRCLKLVIDNVPDTLDWSKVEYGNATETGCFEALSGHLYSINLLNGTVLVDGVPPGLLPSSVVGNKLYIRTFGQRNFESVVLGAGHYRTARKVDDRYLYEFKKSGSHLHILEHDVSSQNPTGVLLLLKRQTLNLPKITIEAHSHWYSYRHDAVVLRPPSFKGRHIEHVLTRDEAYVIPYEYQSLPINKICEELEKFDRFLVGDTSVTRLLCRLERKEHIHVTWNPETDRLRYRLPRFKLEFEQTSLLVSSMTFNQYHVVDEQVLDDTLVGVSSYVILGRDDGHKIVVFPSGALNKDGVVSIPEEWNEQMRYFVYDVHGRFRHLIAKDTLGRLQLAGLYAATSCYLADGRLRKEGAFVATELVRQCWTNEPLSDPVHKKLLEVSKLSCLSCTLRLMCSYIWKSSNSVRFLHTNERPTIESELDMDPLAVDEYRQNVYSQRLFPAEEAFLLGTQRLELFSAVLRPPEISHTNSFVQDVEDDLYENFLVVTVTEGSKPFPLKTPHAAEGVEKKVFDDLCYSWDTHLSHEEIDVSIQKAFCRTLRRKTERKRNQYEDSLMKRLDHHGNVMFKLSKLSGSSLWTSPLDLLCMAWDEKHILRYNPVEDDDFRINIRLDVIDWMMVCVLEDKLTRILQNANHQHKLLEELTCKREWDPWDYPKWLAFEVEQRLQIRPYQYNTVKQLLHDPGSVIQLNMGLGKTSVLVPMLILELTKSSKAVVRINLLASISHVTTNDYRATLLASVHHVKIFTMPFHRDVPLEAQHASLLSDEIERCRKNFGCIVVTPQHRNSLLLKQYDQDVFVNGLTATSFVDVIDESDAILDHSFQLVYAVGNQNLLPAGQARWTIIEAFLEVLVRSTCTDTLDVISNPRLVHREKCPPGSFPKLRLLSLVHKQEDALGEALCKQFIESPAYELLWTKNLSNNDSSLLANVICDKELKDVEKIIQSNTLFSKYESEILIARGCIAYGLLFHGLRSRHRVHYGIGDSGKKMAVPFAASDTPKPRAEYGHPDMAILYTCLSYYHDGLSREAFKEAVHCLQGLGPKAQDEIYKIWIESVAAGVNPEDLRKFDNILKVDTDNAVQFGLMYRSFRSSMEVVSFWMNNYVFPLETYQFPARRVTSAWNLVDGGNAVGFSGTDDNRFLLPLDIKQIVPDDLSLSATNGEMIDRILTCTHTLCVLEEDEKCPLWKTLLCKCVAIGVYSLVDVAGLMAGVSNEDAAEFIAASNLDATRFNGVVYYDTKTNAWNVYERRNKRHVALKVSSLVEKDCFCYFDESRCRGSDLKLKLEATALVTLEPALTKDKFLQGCARMRQLRRDGQSLILAGTSEVLTSETSVKDILQTIVSNTIDKNKNGVLEWLDRGLNHDIFPETVPIDVSLPSMYSKQIGEHEDIGSFVENRVQNALTSERITAMVHHCVEIGTDHKVQVTKLSEECEREIESEALQDQMEEIQVPNELPYSEVDWPFEQAFIDPERLFSSEFVLVKDLIRKKLGSDLSTVHWSNSLYCTWNFWNAIQSQRNPESYLRPVNTFLLVPGGRVVLVSEYEADKLLPFWWQQKNDSNTSATFKSKRKTSVQLQHLMLAIKGVTCGGDNADFPSHVLASMKLFHGCVEFNAAERSCLSTLFQKLNSRPLILRILSMRDRTRFLDRSDLDIFSLGRDEDLF